MHQQPRPAAQPYCNEPRPPIVLNEVPEARSRQVRAIGYDPAARVLAVQFRFGEGAIYHYPGITSELHQGFVNAESLGIFHSARIKELAFKKYRPEEPLAAAA